MEVYMVRFLCNTPTTRTHQLDRARIFIPVTLNRAKWKQKWQATYG